MSCGTFKEKVLRRFREIIGLYILIYSSVPHATLIDRGGGLLYDTVLDVTWLQDANYATTSGFDADGRLGIYSARQWVDDLEYYDSNNNITYDDWRLPTRLEDDLPFHFGWWVLGGAIDPTPTVGPHTELSYMYYVNLGLNGYLDTHGAWATNFGVHGDSTFGGQNNVELVQNLQGGEYWLGFSMADVSNNYDTQPFTFSMNTGNHNARQHDSLFVWAVRDGDVISAPEPSSLFLMIIGILSIIIVNSRLNNHGQNNRYGTPLTCRP